MTDHPIDPRRSRIHEEKLDRIGAELRQIRFLLWFLSCVGAVVVVSMLPQLLTNVFYAAVFIAAFAGLWFLTSRVSQIPIVKKWRSRTSSVSPADQDGR
jgi:hypothetical protein